MCIRYSADIDRVMHWSRKINAWISLEDWAQALDIFPGYEAPIIKQLRDGSNIELAKWGLIPKWVKDSKFGAKNAYNARSETITEKPTFREAFKSRRCIAPSTAYCEQVEGRWLKFSPTNSEVFAFAAVYEPPNGLCLTDSFSIVTTEANTIVAGYFDRMPLILADEDVPAWLDPEASPKDLLALLIPCPSEWMSAEDIGSTKRAQKQPESKRAPSLFDEE